MRLLVSLILVGLAFAEPAAAALRLPLELPIRYPQVTGAHRPPAPAYAGDVLEIRLTGNASRYAWPAYRAGGRRASLGLAALDRVALELGGVSFEPEFRGETPPPPGSTAPDFTAFYVAHLPPGLALETALERFGVLPEVVSAEPIAILPVSAVPNDSLWSSSYYFFQPSRRDLHAPEAWDVTRGDTTVVVGILDTGVVPYHPDLGGDSVWVMLGRPSQIWTNWIEKAGVTGVDDDANGYVDDLHGWDFVHVGATDVNPYEDHLDPDNDPNDFVAHGTGVAGVVGALTDNGIGVAGTCWNVRLMPLRIGWAYAGAGLGNGEVRMDFVAEAVRYATRMGVQVLNCSFASLNLSGLELALDAAESAGVTVVTSAGNCQPPDCIDPQPNYIATRNEVISVASVGPGDVLSGFSNRGPQVDLCAPGENIASTWMVRPSSGDSIAFRQPSYRSTLNGTSFSAPLVAGAAALLLARPVAQGRDPVPPEGVLLRLTETTDDISAENSSWIGQYGSGRLNLHRALTEEWRSTVTRLGGRVNGAAAVFGTNLGGSRIALVTRNNALVILDGATLDTVAVTSLPGVVTSGVTAGPLGEGRGMGLFVSQQDAISGFRPNGSVLPGWPVSVAGGAGVQLRGCALGDLEGDGTLEVVGGSTYGFLYAWHSDGTPVTGFPTRASVAPVNAVAIARFGSATGNRIIASAEDGTVAVLASDGAMLPGWPHRLVGQPSSPVEGFVAGGPTVVVGAGNYLYGFTPEGEPREGFAMYLGSSVESGEEVTIADLDLDGHNEMFTATTTSLDVRDSTGAERSDLGWPQPLIAAPFGSPVLGHLTGGESPELMVMAGSGLVAFTHDATPIAGFPKPGGAGARPTLADLDGDGTTEVIAGSGPSKPLLYVYDAGPGSFAAEPQPWPTFRGNMARTGSASYAPTAVADVVPPGGISDLSAAIREKIVLSWTAPGDDGGTGRVAEYDVRASSSPITEDNFESAGRLTTVWPPSDPGGRDTALAVEPTGSNAVYFAMRAYDEDGNAGPISNVIRVDLIPGSQGIALAPVSNPSRVPAGLVWRAAPGAAGGRNELRVHDVLGRRVLTIDLGAGAGGTLLWDGRDQGGRRVPAGLYLVRLLSGTRHVQTRVVLLP